MAEFMMIGALGGMAVGMIPAISGAVKGKIGLAVGGFFACVVSGAILGLLLAVPVCAVFMFLIFKNSN